MAGAVVFTSRATNLVADQVDAEPAARCSCHGREAGTTALVSRAAGSVATAAGNGPSESPVVSADGRFVAFLSRATDLVAGQVDTNDEADVFLYDRETGTTVLASRAAVSPVTAGNGSRVSSLAMSGDGAVVAFASDATDLVAGQVDLNQGLDVFVYSRDAGTTALASRARGTGRGAARSGGLVVTGNGPSETPVLSADGRLLVFQSVASNLTGDDDVNGFFDVFAAMPTCADRPCVAGGAR